MSLGRSQQIIYIRGIHSAGLAYHKSQIFLRKTNVYLEQLFFFMSKLSTI